MHTIKGKPLLGFGDFFSGYDNVGAAKPPTRPGHPAGKGVPGKPGPVRKYPTPSRSATMKHHGEVMKKGHDAVVRAAQTILNASKLLARRPAALPVKRPTALAARLPGKVVHVGANVAAALTPKQKAAVQKHNAAVAKAAQAAKVLAQKAVATKKAVTELARKMSTQHSVAKKLRAPLKGRVHVGHLLADPMIGEAVGHALQQYYSAVGADPDPTNPGFLTDGTPDPAATTAPPPDLGLPPDLVGPTTDPLDIAGLGPAPPMDQYIPDLVAMGGIVYDGSKGTPEGYIGSYGLFTRQTDDEAAAGGKWVWPVDWMNHHGYVFGKYDKDLNGGIPGGDEIASGKWNKIDGGKGRGNWASNPDASEALSSYTKQAPNGKMYGPIVGNPFYKDFAALRVDGNGVMGWLPQEAPDWVTFPIKQAAALTAAAAKKAADEAAAADAAANAKAQADAAAAQAAQDAANALAESAAVSAAKVTETQAAAEAKVAETEHATQAAAAEVQAQQALVQQQAAETEAKGVETEQMKQAGQLMIEQAQRQAAYYAQHPEEEFAPPPAAAEGEGEEGGEEGGEEAPPEEEGGGEAEEEEGGGDEGGGGEAMGGWGNILDDYEG